MKGRSVHLSDGSFAHGDEKLSTLIGTRVMEFTRSERKMLRELAGNVYEAEAREILEELDAAFDLWRQGETLSSELLTEIHEFHQHQSRELWSMYQAMDEATIVARGIGFGLIPEDSVPMELREKLDVKYWAERGR